MTHRPGIDEAAYCRPAIRLGAALLAAACALPPSVESADWLQFRGSDISGVAFDQQGPSTLAGDEVLAWKIPLTGRGASGPIIVGDRVFLTSSSGPDQARLHVQCFDVRTGTELWHRQFWATGRTQCHDKMCVATPTPASDGERIFAFYSSNDLACLDLDGNLLWYRGLGRDFPNASNSLGMASSPVVVDDTLVVQVESDAEAFATGLDVDTGVARWKIPRPVRANWTSPTVLHLTGDHPPLLALQSSAGISAVEPRTGREVWKYTDGAATIPSSIASGDRLFVPSHGLTALKSVPGKSEPQQLWRANKLRPAFASPLILGNCVYVLNSAGVLICADLDEGKTEWQMRLKGPLSASPVAAGNRLYFVNEEGLAQMVRVDDQQGEVVSERALEETILCTPAIADGALFVRSDSHLWKFADPLK